MGKKKKKKGTLHSAFTLSNVCRENENKSMPQLSPFNPRLRKYSEKKRPARHHHSRQGCLSKICGSYFCWLLISPPPSLPPILLLLSRSWHLSQRRHFTAHPLFLLSRERLAGTRQPLYLCPHSSPPHVSISDCKGLGGTSAALFHVVEIPKATKNIFVLKRKPEK